MLQMVLDICGNWVFPKSTPIAYFGLPILVDSLLSFLFPFIFCRCRKLQKDIDSEESTKDLKQNKTVDFSKTNPKAW